LVLQLFSLSLVWPPANPVAETEAVPEPEAEKGGKGKGKKKEEEKKPEEPAEAEKSADGKTVEGVPPKKVPRLEPSCLC
jgi:hypothetical protein